MDTGVWYDNFVRKVSSTFLEATKSFEVTRVFKGSCAQTTPITSAQAKKAYNFVDKCITEFDNSTETFYETKKHVLAFSQIIGAIMKHEGESKGLKPLVVVVYASEDFKSRAIYNVLQWLGYQCKIIEESLKTQMFEVVFLPYSKVTDVTKLRGADYVFIEQKPIFSEKINNWKEVLHNTDNPNSTKYVITSSNIWICTMDDAMQLEDWKSYLTDN